MFIRDVGTSLLRRWYLTLIGLLATAGLCLGVLHLVPPTYEMKANVVLLPPKSSVEPGDNPFLLLGGLETVVDVLTRAMTSQSVGREITAGSASAVYTAEADATTNSPIVVITVEDSSKAGAESTLNAAIAQSKASLADVQRPLDIAPDALITSIVLTQDKQPTTVLKTQLRFTLAAAAIGLVASVLLVALIDGLLARRRSDKSDANEKGPRTRAGSRRKKRAAPRLKSRSGKTTREPKSFHDGLAENATSSDETRGADQLADDRNFTSARTHNSS